MPPEMQKFLDFIQENLIECCRDYVTLSDTAELPQNTPLRNAAALAPVPFPNQLQLAKAMTADLAIREVAQRGREDE